MGRRAQNLRAGDHRRRRLRRRWRLAGPRRRLGRPRQPAQPYRRRRRCRHPGRPGRGVGRRAGAAKTAFAETARVRLDRPDVRATAQHDARCGAGGEAGAPRRSRPATQCPAAPRATSKAPAPRGHAPARDEHTCTHTPRACVHAWGPLLTADRRLTVAQLIGLRGGGGGGPRAGWRLAAAAEAVRGP